MSISQWNPSKTQEDFPWSLNERKSHLKAMNTYRNVLLLPLLMAMLSSYVAAKSWRGIVPLHSTNADVERLLGKPAITDGYGLHYDLENETIVLALVTEAGTNSCSRDVPANTVLRIAVTPKQRVQISDPQFQSSKFAPFNEFLLMTEGFQAYVDDEDGLMVRTHWGYVDRIVYMAEKKDQGSCPGYWADSVLMASRINCVLCSTPATSCRDSAQAGTIVPFTVSVGGTEKLTYKWTVDKGRITNGQGTPSINVDTSKVHSKTLTATVEIGGNPGCPNTSSCTTQITVRRK
jgi:hypothetical protein